MNIASKELVKGQFTDRPEVRHLSIHKKQQGIVPWVCWMGTLGSVSVKCLCTRAQKKKVVTFSLSCHFKS